MPDQPSFPGLEPKAPAPRRDRLFFAVFPDPEAAASITDLAERLRVEHGLTGQPLRPERLHVTINHLGDFDGVPEDIASAAREAGAAVSAAPFNATFDYAMSFKGRANNFPFVLRGDGGVADLIGFQQALGAQMLKAGLGRSVEKSFTPHVTMLYDRKLVGETPVEEIRWTVRELILVHSLLGQGRHEPLGRWPLGGAG